MSAPSRLILPFQTLVAFALTMALPIHSHAAKNEPAAAGHLFDFSGAASETKWEPMTDRVMGGRSDGAVRIENGLLHFSGNLSLENRGGFSLFETVETKLDFSNAKGMKLRVRGDGRTYQLRLATSALYSGDRVQYRADFPTVEGEWREVTVPFAGMTPSHHGETLDGPPLDLADIEQVGILLGDKKPGKFALEVDWMQPE